MDIDLSLTKKQFLRSRSASIFCPRKFNLKSKYTNENCEGKITCNECWEDAVKYIKFKEVK